MKKDRRPHMGPPVLGWLEHGCSFGKHECSFGKGWTRHGFRVHPAMDHGTSGMAGWSEAPAYVRTCLRMPG